MKRIIRKFKNKLSDKKGGFKEVLYDNTGIVMVIVLISVTVLTIFISIKGFGKEIVGDENTDGILKETINKVEEELDM